MSTTTPQKPSVASTRSLWRVFVGIAVFAVHGVAARTGLHVGQGSGGSLCICGSRGSLEEKASIVITARVPNQAVQATPRGGVPDFWRSAALHVYGNRVRHSPDGAGV